MAEPPVVWETCLTARQPDRKGKVRDIYDLGESLLFIATDRISAFDVVLPTPIPQKGILLNQISLFWFEKTKPVVENHVIGAEDSLLPPAFQLEVKALGDRWVVVRKAKPLPIECIVRGYLSGSAWKEYQTRGSVCSIPLPKGMKESEKLPEPIFTPSTKADRGHDENISFGKAAQLLGSREKAEEIQELSLRLYRFGAAFAEERGLLLADTKFEFGFFDEKIILIDEVLTPDSSRYWPKDGYRPGAPQPSFDKQFVRDYLLSLKNWNRTPPGPELPLEIVEKTRLKYIECYERLTGKPFVTK